MKTIVLVINLIFLTILSFGQDCFKVAPEANMDLDYCNLWLNRTFQGTIGDDNQRIEVRFIEISQDNQNSSQYIVKGKSRVHDNVCDFEGLIIIDKIMLLDETNGGCKEPGLSDGMVYGCYEFKENPKQNHVGIFRGEFKTMFDNKDDSFVLKEAWLGQEDFNLFLGDWSEYGKENSRFCAWGFQIPPSKKENLFKHYDNEFHLFNSEYFDRGWNNFVLSNLDTFIRVPIDFETNALRYEDGFVKYSKQEIDQAILKENEVWW